MDSNTKKTDKPSMCSTSACDLEEIPLDDDDPNSVEFRILAYYVRHHVFKSTPAVFSPKLPRTRSLSQKGLGSWSANESWTQVSWPCRNSRSSEKPINLAKKKSSWKALLGLVEKEEESQSLPAGIQRQGLRTAEFQGGRPSQQWSRSLPSVDQCLDREAADPRVVSIANRVAEIVYSWPPLDAQGGGVKSRGNLEFQAVCLGREGPQPLASSSKKAEERQGFDEQLPGRAALLCFQDHHRPVPTGCGHPGRIRGQSSGLQGCPCDRRDGQAHSGRQPPDEQGAGLWGQVPEGELLALGPAAGRMGKNTWAIT
ncbi:apoptosis facilitator Bcl-2-like protein 14 isoform X3 [Microcebus murinus]|uniref:apoptosis facilitator Bcl-2-like protein 14 isoform X3 n=1 Tax=Microcebus murinus TaxID=30608 RepID=UPI003F6ABB56